MELQGEKKKRLELIVPEGKASVSAGSSAPPGATGGREKEEEEGQLLQVLALLLAAEMEVATSSTTPRFWGRRKSMLWLEGSEKEAAEDGGVQWKELKPVTRSLEECVLAGWMQNGPAADGVKLVSAS